MCIDLVGRAESVLPDLLNLALALSLSLRGYQILHAAGICVAGRCAAILGASGSGKSSMVLAAARLGASIVSDEIVPFRDEDGALVVPGGNPRIRVAAPLLDRDELRTLGARPGRGRKIEVDLNRLGLPCTATPSRLSLLILLGNRLGARAPRVRPKRLAPVDAFGSILNSAFNNRMLTVHERESQFQIDARVVRELPCYLLSVREGVGNASAAARWVVEELERSGV